MNPIQGQELEDAAAKLPGWGVENNELVRLATFADFLTALAFVNRVGELAEAEGHHPDIDIRYNKVRLALVTHDAFNAVTEKDLEMAGKISALLPE
jgi:4a-hydroxytetrahydrobiopterin dehydratase